MKSKILALSRNEEFKQLLKKKKVSNKYVTIFFGQLNKKNVIANKNKLDCLNSKKLSLLFFIKS